MLALSALPDAFQLTLNNAPGRCTQVTGEDVSVASSGLVHTSAPLEMTMTSVEHTTSASVFDAMAIKYVPDATLGGTAHVKLPGATLTDAPV